MGERLSWDYGEDTQMLVIQGRGSQGHPDTVPGTLRAAWHWTHSSGPLLMRDKPQGNKMTENRGMKMKNKKMKNTYFMWISSDDGAF